jgi:hypothetical protein
MRCKYTQDGVAQGGKHGSVKSIGELLREARFAQQAESLGYASLAIGQSG